MINLIFLNGPSGIGKDSLAIELRKLFEKEDNAYRSESPFRNSEIISMKSFLVSETLKEIGKNYPYQFIKEFFSGYTKEELIHIFYSLPFSADTRYNVAKRVLESKVFTDRTLKEMTFGELFECNPRGLYAFSPRGLLQHTSENVLKPKLGQEFVGKAAGDWIHNQYIQHKNRLHEGRNKLIKTYLISDSGFTDEAAGILDYLLKAHMDVRAYVVKLHDDKFSFDGDTREYINTPYLKYRLNTYIDKPNGLSLKAINFANRAYGREVKEAAMDLFRELIPNGRNGNNGEL
jgi:hypothetical protein